MNSFKNLLPSKESKKRIKQSFSAVLFEKAFTKGIKPNVNDYTPFEEMCINYLLKFNNRSKKYNSDLVRLWGLLEMEKFLDSEFRKTINPYCSNLPIEDLDTYLSEDAKIKTLLDIKYIKKLTINKMDFQNVYIATYEINDNNEENSRFRPYVEIYRKKYDDTFIKIGCGYDTNNNDIVELNFDNFNYAVFLTSKGIIQIPLTGKNIKIHVQDVLSQGDILKILSGVDTSEVEITK